MISAVLYVTEPWGLSIFHVLELTTSCQRRTILAVLLQGLLHPILASLLCGEMVPLAFIQMPASAISILNPPNEELVLGHP